MKKLKKLNLHQLNQVEMDNRTMNMIRGGNNCGCGCSPADKETNFDANWSKDLYSPGGSVVCSWEGGYNSTDGVIVYGGSKMPGMP